MPAATVRRMAYSVAEVGYVDEYVGWVWDACWMDGKS
jgi:hypothetical protein